MPFSVVTRNVRRVSAACAVTLGLLAAARPAAAAPVGTITMHAQPAQTTVGTNFTGLTVTGNFSGTGYPTSSFFFQVDNGTLIPAGCSAYGTTGICQVSYPTASLSAGSHVVKVIYPGDSGYAAASTTSTLFVNSASANYIDLSVQGVVSNYGVASVQLSVTAILHGAFPTTATKVNFSIDGGQAVIAQCAITSNSQVANRVNCTATYPVTGLVAGLHSITFDVPADGTTYTTDQTAGNTLLLQNQ